MVKIEFSTGEIDDLLNALEIANYETGARIYVANKHLIEKLEKAKKETNQCQI